MPAGREFIKHEFDEAIEMQKNIVSSAKELAGAHPLASSRAALKELQPTVEAQLETLESFGALFDAKGKKEDVVKGMETLMKKMLSKATEKDAEDSDVYEAHAVLLGLLRKQQDSAPAVYAIAQEREDRKLAAAARKMKRELDAGTKTLQEELAKFAVHIAKQPDKKES